MILYCSPYVSCKSCDIMNPYRGRINSSHFAPVCSSALKQTSTPHVIDANCRTPSILNFTRLWARMGTYGHLYPFSRHINIYSMPHLIFGLHRAYKEVDSRVVDSRVPHTNIACGLLPLPCLLRQHITHMRTLDPMRPLIMRQLKAVTKYVEGIHYSRYMLILM
jgi:hypothetical protein